MGGMMGNMPGLVGGALAGSTGQEGTVGNVHVGHEHGIANYGGGYMGAMPMMGPHQFVAAHMAALMHKGSPGAMGIPSLGMSGKGMPGTGPAGDRDDRDMACDIRDFCDKWKLEGRHESRLMEQFRKRSDTWKSDLASLDITLGEARVPAALLSVKLREMDEGTFVAKGEGRGGGSCGKGGGSALPSWMANEVRDLLDRFTIDDDRLRNRLEDAMRARQATFKDDIRSLAETLSNARNPPGLLSVKIRELQDGSFEAKGGGRKGSGREWEDGGGGGSRSWASGDGGGGRAWGSGTGGCKSFGDGAAGIMSADRKKQLFGSMSRSESRRRSRSKSRKRDRRDSRKRSRSRRSDSRKNTKHKNRDRDRDKGRKKEKDRNGSGERERDKERDKKKEKDKAKSKGRDKDQDDSREAIRLQGQQPVRSPSRNAVRERSSSVHRGRARSRSHEDDGRSKGVAIAPPKVEEEDIHHDTTCGRCGMAPIRGDRFKCSVCDSFDLCESCYERKAQFHARDHRFFAQKAQLPSRAPPAHQHAACTTLSPPMRPFDDETPATPAPIGATSPTLPDAPMSAAASSEVVAEMMMRQMQAMHAQMGIPPALPTGTVPMCASSATEQTHFPTAGSTPGLALSHSASPATPMPEPVAAPPRSQLAPVAPPSPTELTQAITQQECQPAWLPPDLACGICGAISSSSQPHGVICRRRRKNGALSGCGQGVCWTCMDSRPRADFGMVRTTREEFESLDKEAWWMHEKCMDIADLRSYYGGDKELAHARAMADEAEEVRGTAVGIKKLQASQAPDPEAVVKDQVRAMSVRQLKDYIQRHGKSHAECVEKADLLAKALEVAALAPMELPLGPAWMLAGTICRSCAKPTAKEQGGVICRRRRHDGSLGGCGEGVCWRCMKRAPRESFGQVRTTKEEFESLEEDAWWMHERCFADGDYKDYFGESEPEDFYLRRTGGKDEDLWDDTKEQQQLKVGTIMQRC